MGTHLRVLTVEDSEDDAILLVRELRRGGYEPVFERVETPEAMAAALDEKTWDIIIADCIMPQFSGLAALNLFKESGIDLPFIIVSDKICEDTAGETMKAGAHDYVMKGNLARLVPAVERELRYAAMRRENKQMVEALQAAVLEWRTTFDAIGDGVWLVDLEGKILRCNKAAAELLGRPFSEIIGRNCFELVHGTSQPIEGFPLIRMRETRHRETSIYQFNDRWYNVSVDPLLDGAGNLTGAIHLIVDITDHKRMEKALHDSMERFRSLAESTSDWIWEVDIKGVYIYASPKVRELLGYEPDKVIGKIPFDFMPPEEAKRIAAEFKAIVESSRPFERLENTNLHQSGQLVVLETSGVPVFDVNGKLCGYRGVDRDITGRKQMEDRIRQDAGRAKTIAEISLTLSEAGLDHQAVLDKVARRIAEITSDACFVSLLSDDRQWLTPVASHHPNPEAVTLMRNLLAAASLRVDEWLGGRIIETGQPLFIPVASEEQILASLKPVYQLYMERLGVQSMLILPMRAQGRVIGTLDLLREIPGHPYTTDDQVFLQNLADLVAIAIDSATLFDSLQRSNIELTLAYDATIEGLSYALDLRDKETEGHSQRVTEMTLRLARAMGISEAELVHVRRGALLHDIGKMGVPDYILLKPGQLTDEEWESMRKHPVFAFEMLSPISYLRPALEIPYCHHEKWDGTGYPRGLKGEQIPLAARIFTVLDVWDALRSDRPYRPAWPEEEAREHICSLAGADFDPKVVEAFLAMVAQ